jgi:uncharacterized membrane protein YgcG
VATDNQAMRSSLWSFGWVQFVWGVVVAAAAFARTENAFAQDGPVRDSTVVYQGIDRDGFEEARFSIQYRFGVCAGDVGVTVSLRRMSNEFSPHYILNRARYEIPRDKISNPEPISFPAAVSGGAFTKNLSKIQTGRIGGCMSPWVTWITVGSIDTIAGPKATPEQRAQAINALMLRVEPTPAFRDSSVESWIRAQEREKERAAAAAVAEEKRKQEEAARAAAAAAAEEERKQEEAARVAAAATAEEERKQNEAERRAREETERKERAASSGGPDEDSSSASASGSDDDSSGSGSGSGYSSGSSSSSGSGSSSGSSGSGRYGSSSSDSSSSDSSSSNTSSTTNDIDYQQRYAEQQARNEAIANQAAEAVTSTMGAMFAQIQENNAREAAAQAQRDEEERIRHEQRIAELAEECARRVPVEIESPQYFIPEAKEFDQLSGICGARRWIDDDYRRDWYGFNVEETTELQFIAAGQGYDTVVDILDGDGKAIDDDVPRSSITFEPGKYGVIVRANYMAVDGGYYLRIMETSRCWVDDAIPAEQGRTKLSADKSNCTDGGGRAGHVVHFGPTPYSQNARRLTISAKSKAGAPKLIVLGGEEGRMVLAKYSGNGNEAVAIVDYARPDSDYYVIVSRPEDEEEPTDLDFETNSEDLGYESHFRGDFMWTLGGVAPTFGQFAFTTGIGFSLGAQVGRMVGVAGVVNGIIGMSLAGDTTHGYGSITVGPGVHYGRQISRVRLTPAVAITTIDNAFRVGPALRLDAQYAGSGGGLAAGLYTEYQMQVGEGILSFGMMLISNPGPRQLRPDDHH